MEVPFCSNIRSKASLNLVAVKASNPTMSSIVNWKYAGHLMALQKGNRVIQVPDLINQ
jgi:hypothetical protein